MFQGHKRLMSCPESEPFFTTCRFRINGTSDPDELQGEFALTVTRDGAVGKFLLTVRDTIAECQGVTVNVHANADHTAIVVDPTTIEVGGTRILEIHTKTGGSDADPADNTYVSVIIAGKLTSRVR